MDNGGGGVVVWGAGRVDFCKKALETCGFRRIAQIGPSGTKWPLWPIERHWGGPRAPVNFPRKSFYVDPYSGDGSRAAEFVDAPKW